MLRLLEPNDVHRFRETEETDASVVALLDRLKAVPDDPDAWAAFVEGYGRTIYGWCRGWGLQPADAQDVTQEVLARLAVRLRHFRYDPRRNFRAWLKTVVKHERQRFLTRQRKAGRARGGDAAIARLAAIEAREEFLGGLEDSFDPEVLQQATAHVRSRVDPKTWKAFHLLAFEGCSGAEAARHLGIEIGTAFVARSRVQRMLRDEIARLERRAGLRRPARPQENSNRL